MSDNQYDCCFCDRLSHLEMINSNYGYLGSPGSRFVWVSSVKRNCDDVRARDVATSSALLSCHADYVAIWVWLKAFHITWQVHPLFLLWIAVGLGLDTLELERILMIGNQSYTNFTFSSYALDLVTRSSSRLSILKVLVGTSLESLHIQHLCE